METVSSKYASQTTGHILFLQSAYYFYPAFLCLHHILAVADNLLGTGSHVVLVAGNLHVQLSLCVQTVLLQLTYLNTVGLELGEIACLIQRNTQRKHQCGTSAPIIIEDVPILVVE